MGIRFAKSIKIGDYLKLNISKSGISATVGKKGASINIGGKGTFLNLSPTVAGITGTGLSYRKKLTGGVSSLFNKLTGKDDKEVKENKDDKKQDLDTSVIEEYATKVTAQTSLQCLADNVLDEETLRERITKLESESEKQIYELALSGDEDTIESLVGAILNNLELDIDVKANYELEDDILYVDLDLPEIESINAEYPCVSKNEIVYKKKTQAELKEEYGKTIIGLGIYLAANFFNVSSYIKQVVLSGFTSRRDNNGDLKDEYLYSVKFTREIFEKTDLEKVENGLDFLLKFENRINVTNTYVFKAIKPYEMETQVKTNSLVEDALAGLKSLGYKANDINAISEELAKQSFETSGEYLKYALNLLNAKK